MAKRNRGRGGRTRDIAILALCVLMPIVGLPLMWLCSRWKPGVRLAMTVVATASLAVLVSLIPLGDNRPVGGVTFVGAKPQAEIYGPELPETMITDYAVPSAEDTSREVFVSVTEVPETYVYATESEGVFHRANCPRRYATSIQMTPYEAYYYGYTPCKKCEPPTYTPPNADAAVEPTGAQVDEAAPAA